MFMEINFILPFDKFSKTQCTRLCAFLCTNYNVCYSINENKPNRIY